MNARSFLSFFRSPAGLLILFFVGVGLALFTLRSCGGLAPPASGAGGQAQRRDQLGDTLEKIRTGIAPAQFPNPTPTPTPLVVQAPPKNKPEPPPLTLYSAETKPVRLSPRYAPYGRLVKCQLVNTVDSANTDTPIIGVVTEDVDHDGRMVLPSGTEVHGRAQRSRIRDRVASDPDWVLVFRERTDDFANGQELKVSGVALDMEEISSDSKWDITDGSAGLRGQLLKTDDFQEIKLFVASVLSGVARGAQDNFITSSGLIVQRGSVKNAFAEGAGDAIEQYARLILDQIEKEGYYVRVPAGKQFYLYVTETVDQKRARVGLMVRTAASGEAGPEPTATPADRAPIPDAEGTFPGPSTPGAAPLPPPATGGSVPNGFAPPPAPLPTLPIPSTAPAAVPAASAQPNPLLPPPNR